MQFIQPEPDVVIDALRSFRDGTGPSSRAATTRDPATTAPDRRTDPGTVGPLRRAASGARPTVTPTDPNGGTARHGRRILRRAADRLPLPVIGRSSELSSGQSDTVLPQRRPGRRPVAEAHAHGQASSTATSPPTCS
jgi:hypothetical protein